MVAHQAVTVEFDLELLMDVGEERQEAAAVVVAIEDRLLPGAPVHDVVPSAGELDSGSSCHGRAN